MSFNLNLICHLRAIDECLPWLGAHVEMKFGSFALQVRARGRHYDLFPQYAILRNGKIAYTCALTSEVTHFIGWRHYQNRLWSLAGNKLAFKQYCATNGLRTPRLFSKTQDIDADFIVKRTRSSFGEGIEGPFRSEAARSMNCTLRAGEYYEEFINGEIAKIWYWDEKPACLEIKPMARVVGNGRDTLRELVNGIRSSFVEVDWNSVEVAARYQETSLDTRVAEGREVLVDFRYMSSLHPSRLTNLNVLNRCEAPILDQLQSAGPIFWLGIPEDIRSSTLFTIDAIIDSNQRLWFLEMNSNPVVHPDAYAAMFEGLFGPSMVAEVERDAGAAALLPRCDDSAVDRRQSEPTVRQVS